MISVSKEDRAIFLWTVEEDTGYQYIPFKTKEEEQDRIIEI